MAENDAAPPQDAPIISDLSGERWWRDAAVERLGDTEAWAVSDTSAHAYQSMIAHLGERLIGRAVILCARVDRQLEPGSVCAIRVLLTNRATCRETIWEALLDPYTGECRVQANAYAAFAEIAVEDNAFAVSVVAMTSEHEAVDARAQIVPAIGRSLGAVGPEAVGTIVVRDVAYRIASLSEGQSLTLRFRRNQIQRARSGQRPASGLA